MGYSCHRDSSCLSYIEMDTIQIPARTEVWIVSENHLYLLISALSRSVAFLAACAKSFSFEAKMILRDELIIIPQLRLSFPADTVATTSPPCAPMPGMRIGISPT